MTPIKENMIRVIDENNNVLLPTYIRRAKGLVKAGRAYWTGPDENEICLIDPPDISEDKMEEKNLTELTIKDYEELHRNAVTPELILERMEQIRLDCQHIYAALDMLKNFQINDSVNGGYGDAERAKAISAIVQSRELTLQNEISLLNKMYDDLIREKHSTEDKIV